MKYPNVYYITSSKTSPYVTGRTTLEDRITSDILGESCILPQLIYELNHSSIVYAGNDEVSRLQEPTIKPISC